MGALNMCLGLRKNKPRQKKSGWFFFILEKIDFQNFNVFSSNFQKRVLLFFLPKFEFGKCWTFFWKYNFSTKNTYFSMIFFYKFISWSRRIDLKRFQNDSGSLKAPCPALSPHAELGSWFWKCSNCFVFKSYMLRISEMCVCF